MPEITFTAYGNRTLACSSCPRETQVDMCMAEAFARAIRGKEEVLVAWLGQQLGTAQTTEPIDALDLLMSIGASIVAGEHPSYVASVTASFGEDMPPTDLEEQREGILLARRAAALVLEAELERLEHEIQTP